MPVKRTPKHGHGQLLTGGKPGHPGGRPRDEFYGWLASVIYSPEARGRFEGIVKGKSSAMVFLKALRWGTERLHGKPIQPISIPELPQEERVARVLQLVTTAKQRVS